MDFMFQAVVQATFISKCVLALLLVMSLASWAYMAGKWLHLRKAKQQTYTNLHSFDDANDFRIALSELERDTDSPCYTITRRAVREFNRISKTGDTEKLLNDNVRRALHFSIAEEMGKLSSSLALLATAANTAPFIGLFGTVWGIMHSFQAIAMMKSVSLATVAPGIAEALIATAVGLFVAIPATCGYNLFKAQLGAIQADCINFAGMLLNRLQHEGVHCPEAVNFPKQRG